MTHMHGLVGLVGHFWCTTCARSGRNAKLHNTENCPNTICATYHKCEPGHRPYKCPAYICVYCRKCDPKHDPDHCSQSPTNKKRKENSFSCSPDNDLIDLPRYEPQLYPMDVDGDYAEDSIPDSQSTESA